MLLNSMGCSNEDDHYQVAVLGGGPAGCAIALALRGYGISKILVVESGHYQDVRIGESLPPDTRMLLDRLGILADFLAEKHEVSLGSFSSWGSEALGYNDFLFNPHGNGWHLDRRRFDAFLAGKAVSAGVELYTGTRFDRSEPIDEDGFRLRLTSRERGTKIVNARFVVDATGTRAYFARLQGAKRLFHDRLVCAIAWFELPVNCHFSQLTLLEAVEYGWWYAAQLPNRRLVAVLASDSDIIKGNALHRSDRWLAYLKATNYLSRELSSCHFRSDSLMIRGAPSFLLDRVAGHRWLAVGDAASAYDPISSQGIYKALFDGLQAARIIAADLDRDPRGMDEYRTSIVTRFKDYLKNRDYFYRLEQRWTNSPFWKRRFLPTD